MLEVLIFVLVRARSLFLKLRRELQMFDLIVINPSFPRALRESVAQTIDFLIRNTYFVSSGYFQGYL